MSLGFCWLNYDSTLPVTVRCSNTWRQQWNVWMCNSRSWFVYVLAHQKRQRQLLYWVFKASFFGIKHSSRGMTREVTHRSSGIPAICVPFTQFSRVGFLVRIVSRKYPRGYPAANSSRKSLKNITILAMTWCKLNTSDLSNSGLWGTVSSSCKNRSSPLPCTQGHAHRPIIVLHIRRFVCRLKPITK